MEASRSCRRAGEQREEAKGGAHGAKRDFSALETRRSLVHFRISARYPGAAWKGGLPSREARVSLTLCCIVKSCCAGGAGSGKSTGRTGRASHNAKVRFAQVSWRASHLEIGSLGGEGQPQGSIEKGLLSPADRTRDSRGQLVEDGENQRTINWSSCSSETLLMMCSFSPSQARSEELCPR